MLAWKVRFNSDEAQHLHVVWAWANGLLPYRDVFDNHTPLFHILCAPVFRLFGETAEIMIYMRWAMNPLVAISLWCVVKIGERLFSRRVGWWAAVFSGFFPLFLLKTIEFRTDILWVTAWLATIAIAVSGAPTARRMFCVGLVLGATFCVSMKTVILLAALLPAMAVTLFFYGREGGALHLPQVLRGLGAGTAGALIFPLAIIGYFAAHHAVDALYYGVIAHNLMPAALHKTKVASRIPWFLATFPFFVSSAHFIFRCVSNTALAARRTLVLLGAGFYIALLHSYWPLITTQDYLPVTPLFVMLITPQVIGTAQVLSARFPWLPVVALPVAFVAIDVRWIVESVQLHKPYGSGLQTLAEVLRLTDRGDYVMDPKAGAIFRRRPFFHVLEDITQARMKMGLIKDDIVERLIATGTCVASENRLSGKTLDFVLANYLYHSDHCRIAGQSLHPDGQGRSAFEIKIVTTYAIVAREGAVSGKLDGKPYTGKVFLDAGPHEFVSDDPTKPLILMWAQALERGAKPNFSPDSKAGKKIETD